MLFCALLCFLSHRSALALLFGHFSFLPTKVFTRFKGKGGNFSRQGTNLAAHTCTASALQNCNRFLVHSPLTPLTSDRDNPVPLTPAMLLTMKSSQVVKSFKLDQFDAKDLYRTQWRRVQHLANSFWLRWKQEYLPILQPRRIWQGDTGNPPKVGDVVLLRDKTVHRNDWPIGIVTSTNVSEDGRVRSVEVRLGRGNKTFVRPVNQIIVLVSV